MQHHEFLALVQERASLPDRGAAERAVRSTLETVAERVPSGLARHVAAQLPHELAGHLTREPRQAGGSGPSAERPGGAVPPGDGERFDLTVFAARVAWRGGVSEQAALQEAAAVFEVLDAALAPELMERLSHSLPHDIRELLPTTRAEDA
ncbi:hypothetical protein HEK616_72040 [Streptomyces nigrescens]|uniref:DUF2267 domain-containing protein n=2 Tax=Streptomyces TaxID=1883 RepID=A0ABN6R5P1_STRNI|nr:DUF2267 domain-containing protein [Streptomyces nigrescens]MEE4425356.1 DUF2267 domain-containing protein [Streptomyces sp. DSM 41528]BDM73717.1 hypothetical protein HEK616_72040 [Streptomyces nigrescens]